MTTTRTTRASRAGSSGSSANSFSNLNMTLAFKNTCQQSKRSPSKEQRATPISKNDVPADQYSAQTEDHSQTKEDAESAEDDDQGDEDRNGHVNAPPAHRGSHELAVNLQHATGVTADQLGELAGLERGKAVHKRELSEDFEDFDMPRRPSMSDLTDSTANMSDFEFDVADDDDDYAAVDQVSQCSDSDVNLEETETAHLASNVHDWSSHDVLPDCTKDENNIDWEDQRTYDFEFPYPYSDPLNDVMDTSLPFESFGGPAAPKDILSHMNAAAGSTAMDCDPHLVPSIFLRDPSEGSSSSISASVTSDQGERTQTSPTEATAAGDDDTESEDINEEVRQQSHIIRPQTKRKSSKKKRRPSSSKAKEQSKSPQTSRVKKFSQSPKKVQARPKMTARGQITYLSLSNNIKICWTGGRIPIDPSETAPSPELTRSLRSRMFQQAYCPDPSTVNAYRRLFDFKDYRLPMFGQPTSPCPLQLNSPAPAFSTDGVTTSLNNPSNAIFDFSEFIDSDGRRGLTVYEDLLDIGDTDEDIVDRSESHGSTARRVSEIDDQMAENSVTEHITGSTGIEPGAFDMDVDTPCSKRRRTIESSESGTSGLMNQHAFESSNSITA